MNQRIWDEDEDGIKKIHCPRAGHSRLFTSLNLPVETFQHGISSVGGPVMKVGL